jgi:hypothetical protein
MRDISARLSIVEDRGNTIAASIELLRAKLPQAVDAQKVMPDVAADMQPETGIAVEGKPASGPTAGELVQTPAVPAAPVAVSPMPVPEAPAAVNVPVIQPTPEKK